MMRFNYFEKNEAFTKNEDGTYTVNFEKMQEAMISLMNEILYIEGNGDYDKAKQWIEEKGKIMPGLQADLDLLNSSDIPVDIVFKQGKGVVGLN